MQIGSIYRQNAAVPTATSGWRKMGDYASLIGAIAFTLSLLA